jgi:hypothetical protein
MIRCWPSGSVKVTPWWSALRCRAGRVKIQLVESRPGRCRPGGVAGEEGGSDAEPVGQLARRVEPADLLDHRVEAGDGPRRAAPPGRRTPTAGAGERGQTVAISACDITRPQPRQVMIRSHSFENLAVLSAVRLGPDAWDAEVNKDRGG